MRSSPCAATHALFATAAAALLSAGAGGCKDRPSDDRSWTEQARGLKGDEVEDRAAVLNTSRRCAECHARQFREWRTSAHGRAATGVYARVRGTLAAAEAKACDACHVPLSGASDRIARDGVGCDACHTATAASAGAAAVALQPELATKFGPFEDSQDHHFHRVAFSAFVTGAPLCAACHADREEGPVPVFTSTAEWKAGPDADKPCQSCHMEKARAEAAKGEQERDVAHHGFWPEKDQALAAALGMELDLVRASGPTARVALLHRGGGHPLPTDLPERRLLLVVEAVDAKGGVLLRDERRFGRRLVDAKGELAPFFRAVREASDDRLWPGQPRVVDVKLPPRAARVTATLFYERFDPALAATYGEVAKVQVAQRERKVEEPWD